MTQLATLSQHVGRRRPVAGPERALVEEALAARSRYVRRSQIFEEPALATGFPDIVLVELARERAVVPAARLRLQQPHLQLLHYLTLTGVVSVSEIASRLLWRPRDVARAVAQLAAAELVQSDGDLVEAFAADDIFPARRIIAVEAKIRDWRGAVAQATTNTWFASHSLILMPARTIRPDVLAAASEAGIGVLGFDRGRLRIEAWPRTNQIPASYGSWVVAELALRNTSAATLNHWARRASR